MRVFQRIFEQKVKDREADGNCSNRRKTRIGTNWEKRARRGGENQQTREEAEREARGKKTNGLERIKASQVYKNN